MNGSEDVIYSTEGRSPDAGQEPVGNEGEIDTDYIRGPRERNWVVGSQILTGIIDGSVVDKPWNGSTQSMRYSAMLVGRLWGLLARERT